MAGAGYDIYLNDRTQAGARSVKGSFRGVTAEAARTTRAVGAFERGLGGASKSALGLGAAMAGPLGIVTAAAVLTSTLAAATSKALAFDTAMAEVSTLLPIDSADMKVLNEELVDLGAQFGAMPVDTAKAAYQIISAGASSAAEAIDILTAANKLAVGGVTDVNTAADGLTTILNSYGFGASQATDVSDKMFVAMRAGKTTIGELSESISFVSSIAAQAGASLDEVLSATAALTKGGVPTQRAMRGLAQVMAGIVKPSAEAAKLAGKLQFEFNAAALQSQGLAKFLDSVAKATGGSTEKIAQLFGGVESIIPVLSLTGKQAQDFTGILDDMNTSAGKTEEAFGKIADTDAFKLKQAEGEWESFTTKVGQLITQNILGPLASTGLAAIATAEAASNAAGDNTPTGAGSLRGAAQFGVELARPIVDGLDRFFGDLESRRSPGVNDRPRPGRRTGTGLGPVEGDLGAVTDGRSIEQMIMDPFNMAAKKEEERLQAVIEQEEHWKNIDAEMAKVEEYFDSVFSARRNNEAALKQETANLAGRADSKYKKAFKEWTEAVSGLNTELVEVPPLLEDADAARQSEVNSLRSLAQVLAQSNPMMAQLVSTFAAWDAEDPISTMLSGMSLLQMAFDEASKKSREFEETISDLFAGAGRGRSIAEKLFGTEAGLDELQAQVFAPIKGFFDQLVELNPGTSKVAQLENVFAVLGTMTEKAGSDVISFYGDVASQSKLLDQVTAQFGGVSDFQEAVSDAFGYNATLLDVATAGFEDMADAIDDASKASAKLAATERATTFARELQLRRKIAEDFRKAGGDVVTQQAVLQRGIASIALLHASGTPGVSGSGNGSGKVTVGGGGGVGGTGGGGVTDPISVPVEISPVELGSWEDVVIPPTERLMYNWDEVFSFGAKRRLEKWSEVVIHPGADDRIKKDWDAVFAFGAKRRPEKWSNVVVSPGADDRIKKDWDAVFAFGAKRKPEKWIEVVNPPGADDRIAKNWDAVFTFGAKRKLEKWIEVVVPPGADDRIKRRWQDVVEIDGDIAIDKWEDIVSISSTGPEQIPVNWGSVLSFSSTSLNALGVTSWGDVVQINTTEQRGAMTLSTGPEQIGVDWGSVLTFSPTSFEALGITNWDQIVALSSEVMTPVGPRTASANKIPVTWDQVLSIQGGLPIDFSEEEVEVTPATIPLNEAVHIEAIGHQFTVDFAYLKSTQAIDYIPATISLREMLTPRLDSAYVVNFDDLKYLGFLNIIPATVPLSAIIEIDSSEFGEIITTAVQSALDDRAFNSRSLAG